VRWHISPTEENRILLPPFSRPLDVQFEKAHPAWIDYVPFPKMREEFVRNYDAPGFNFETMFLPYTQTLSVNWPYEDKDVLHEAANGSEITINPIFEQHLLDINNWSLGDAFDRACPALRGTYKLKSEGSTLDRILSNL
jgi:hypothetical protein